MVIEIDFQEDEENMEETDTDEEDSDDTRPYDEDEKLRFGFAYKKIFGFESYF